ncbi:MAG TPA: cyclic nucleotide-binding domain-containing protein [Solirubrobacteraceae bacterium]|nr:cyclic nucleotide-binding domain-containing protein [Solirubrobacteraceae bacterium]
MDPKQLERMPLFAGLDKRERARVAQAADEVDVPEGKRLAVEGDLAYEFFVIEDGTARVDVGDEQKGELGPDDFFGEIGTLECDHRRTATVTATSPMKLMVLTGHQFRALSRDLPEVTAKVRAAMAERMGATN